jgi:hypothetical protein
VVLGPQPARPAIDVLLEQRDFPVCDVRQMGLEADEVGGMLLFELQVASGVERRQHSQEHHGQGRADGPQPLVDQSTRKHGQRPEPEHSDDEE